MRQEEASEEAEPGWRSSASPEDWAHLVQGRFGENWGSCITRMLHRIASLSIYCCRLCRLESSGFRFGCF